jgi:hypothetical protein
VVVLHRGTMIDKVRIILVVVQAHESYYLKSHKIIMSSWSRTAWFDHAEWVREMY